ncbi:MAG: transglutaminase family protein [Luteolibacter sp.]|jgi:regulator of sirC expression with transglutaminase-like and TPR domain|nr:transglutaminase family protein [Luteolibacter sp.]
MHEAPPAPEELSALLRLLDDETPEVRALVSGRLALCGGDLSEFLATHPRGLSPSEREVLTELLRPARRAALERDWLAPTGGAPALREDWEVFEAMLRQISDFLHDGIAIRQPLSDALDLLAEESGESGVDTANDLRAFLFEEDRLAGNEAEYDDPRNSDLAWSIAEGRSNPLGLCLIFMLVARRLELVVEAVNFPGHFLCRIYEDGFPIIIDCFDHGRMHLQASLLEDPEMGRAERSILRQSADPGTVLLRLFNNLVAALEGAGRRNDARLMRRLRATLK